MLLTKVISQLKNGATVSIENIANRLSVDTGTVKHAISILCKMEYCEQLTLSSQVNNCKGCCYNSCVSIPDNSAQYWHLTHKGVGYLDRISE